MANREQKIKVKTYIKFDFVDFLQLLFGRSVEVTTTVIVPQDQPIERYNCFSETKFVSTSSHFVKQDQPPFGYVCAPEIGSNTDNKKQ